MCTQSNGEILTVGSAVSLSGLISELQQHQQDMPEGSKLNKLALHISRVRLITDTLSPLNSACMYVPYFFEQCRQLRRLFEGGVYSRAAFNSFFDFHCIVRSHGSTAMDLCMIFDAFH